MKKRYLIVPMVALLLTSNVYAITSNDVTYNNDGTTESLTTTLDNLNSELKRYKTGGSVAASQMLEGATGYSKGELVTGTIKSKAATTYTPGTSNQTIAAGQYLSGAQTIKGDANLVAGNIAKGKSIFGVSGTFTSDANATAAQILSGQIAYVNGSKVIGTMTNNANQTVTATAKSISGNNTQISVPANGYYDTNSKIQIANSTLLNGINKIRDNNYFVDKKEPVKHTYTNLVAGAYYMLIPVVAFDMVDAGWEGWKETSLTLTNGTIIHRSSVGQSSFDMWSHDAANGIVGKAYFSVVPAVIRADATTVSISYYMANAATKAQVKLLLYRIF